MIDKIKTWFASIGWIKTTTLVVGAIVLALAGAKASSRRQKAENQEQLAENILQDHTKKSLDKAEQLQKSAAKHKKAAEDAKAKMAKQLESLGTKNEDISDIAARFNGRRVRRAAGSVTELESRRT